jgi:hypothetical protein
MSKTTTDPRSHTHLPKERMTLSHRLDHVFVLLIRVGRVHVQPAEGGSRDRARTRVEAYWRLRDLSSMLSISSSSQNPTVSLIMS